MLRSEKVLLQLHPLMYAMVAQPPCITALQFNDQVRSVCVLLTTQSTKKTNDCRCILLYLISGGSDAALWGDSR